MLQIAGAVLVCTATTLWGFNMAARGAKRAKDLMEFKNTLILLKSRIEYAMHTLPQAFLYISERTSPHFAAFYAQISNDLERGKTDAGSAWAQGIAALAQTCLSKDDMQKISMLGPSLGNMDKMVQLDAIDMISKGIDATITELNKENPKNARMYRGLGVVSGLLITIILM
jgi:stage III sporulation protein AB